MHCIVQGAFNKLIMMIRTLIIMRRARREWQESGVGLAALLYPALSSPSSADRDPEEEEAVARGALAA